MDGEGPRDDAVDLFYDLASCWAVATARIACTCRCTCRGERLPAGSSTVNCTRRLTLRKVRWEQSSPPRIAF
jgi:hypothetical protein